MRDPTLARADLPVSVDMRASVQPMVQDRARGGADASPGDTAATRLIWLVLRNAGTKRKKPPFAWRAAKSELAIRLEGRFVLTGLNRYGSHTKSLTPRTYEISDTAAPTP